MQSFEDGYYFKVIHVPQVPVDNQTDIIIVYHPQSQMYETSNEFRNSHRNRKSALLRLKKRVDSWVKEMADG